MKIKKNKLKLQDGLISRKALTANPPENQIKILSQQFEQGDFFAVVAGATIIAEKYPAYGFIWKVLGAAYQKINRIEDALKCKIRSVELSPRDPEALINLGNTYNQLGRLREAEEAYRKSLKLKNESPEALCALGNVLNAQRYYHEAELCCRKALLLKPDLAQGYNNLGVALCGNLNYDEAIACFRRAISIDLAYAGAHQNLASVLRNYGRLGLAEESARQAIAIDNNLAEAHDNLACILDLQGRNIEALESARRAMLLRPVLPSFHSNFLFILGHSEIETPENVFKEYVRFGEIFENPLKSYWRSYRNETEPGKCLRVGFVSADLWGHPVARFILPVWAALDTSIVEIWAYSNSAKVDAVTEKLRTYTKAWREVETLTDEELAEQIRHDSIDILIDLSGHTAGNRLMTFARKPAPIQATWIGNPNTTGLNAIDYVITDEGLSPVGLYEQYWVEKFVRLPSAVPFYAGDLSPCINPLPALHNEFITFASFNRANKIGDGVIETWSRVLKDVPDSRMLLGGISDDQLKERFVQRFARYGIDSVRIEFRPRVPTHAYLMQHQEVDIVLDTWPYNGGTTTNHALHMGVPVLTLRGPSMSHCVSACILRQVGLEDWVANTVEDFVQLAKAKASDLPALAKLRAELRERSLTNHLRKPETVARGLEQALRMMWERWCHRLPSEHFEVSKNISIPKSEINKLLTSFSNGRYVETEKMATSMIRRFPDVDFGWKALAAALQGLQRYQEALDAIQTAVNLSPLNLESNSIMGVVLTHLDRLLEAEEVLKKNLSIEPSHLESLSNLGVVYRRLGKLIEAEVCYEKALAIKPDYIEARHNLANVLAAQERNIEAIESFRQVLMINPGYFQSFSNLLFLLTHNESVTPGDLFVMHKEFGKRYENPLKSGWRPHNNDKQIDRVLRVGFVSGDLWNHSLSRYILPVWSELDKSVIEIWVYSNSSKIDLVTEKLRSCSKNWRQVQMLTDEDLAEQIRADNIDVLIDLSGHTAHNRLMTFARKPAPVQVTWLGNPNTTGLTAIDYVITDEGLSPFGLYECYWVEKFARIPSAAAFYVGEDCPDVNQLPALKNQYITFASFNRANKIGDAVLETWGQVLRDMPGSRMLLGGISDERIKEKFVDRFVSMGIESGRLEFRPMVPTQDYLKLHNDVDIILDTWPYNGGTTTNHALHMGVPVLTLRGPSMSHCVSACILRQVGLEGWVADSVENFVRLAKAKASDLQGLAMLRSELRERSLTSPLRKPETVVRGLEQVLRKMWQRWSNGLPPDHFAIEQEGYVLMSKSKVER